MRQISSVNRIVAFAIVGALLSACKGLDLSTNAGLPAVTMHRGSTPIKRTRHSSASGKIQHVVIIMQENRSFNNLFYGFRGAKTVRYGRDSHNHLVTLKPIGLEA